MNCYEKGDITFGYLPKDSSHQKSQSPRGHEKPSWKKTEEIEAPRNTSISENALTHLVQSWFLEKCAKTKKKRREQLMNYYKKGDIAFEIKNYLQNRFSPYEKLLEMRLLEMFDLDKNPPE